MIVEAEGLTKSYGDQEVLRGVDLSAPEGSVLALLGPNGAGKTTTVRVLTTLTRPDGGTARIAGHDVVREPAKVRAVMTLTGQHAAVDNRQTGRENLVMLGRLAHLGRRGACLRAEEMLERFDLIEAADRRVQHWSGGMRRRLDLAMSLVCAPRVVFLDEPTTGLDPASRATVWNAVSELVRAGTTIVLTTQYLEEADRLADRIVLIDGGRVTASGTPQQLKAQVGGERLDLVFADACSLERAAALPVARAATASLDRLELALPTDGGAEHLRSVLDDLAAAGAPAVRVSASRPTLDDAFLALTGRRASSSPPPEAGAPAPADVPVLTATP
jgi:ABC-2 type transport system ATP-binding protein